MQVGSGHGNTFFLPIPATVVEQMNQYKITG